MPVDALPSHALSRRVYAENATLLFSALPAARRTVHFSQGGIRSGGASPSPTAALIPVLLLGGSALAFSGYLALGRLPWLPLPVRAAIVSALFLFVMILLFRAAARGYRRVMSALKMPMEMDSSQRLQYSVLNRQWAITNRKK